MAKKPFPPHTALISITSKNKDFVNLDNKPEYLLQIKANKPSRNFNRVYKKIFRFNESLIFKNKTNLLICQCETGDLWSVKIADNLSEAIESVKVCLTELLKEHFTNKINNLHEQLNKSNKLLDKLKIVNIINSSPIDSSDAWYQVNDGENKYSLICPTIEFNTTDKYIFVSVKFVFFSRERV